ncbi:unnamed protein product [Prorocentrum cordatum]|uniref:Uncharacterized protein n=1 Tax=Prorocentrum cordatum TaxID=2364126 RepID=A0ABN9UB18_9DINO|nr:unnamed protein product [Polarella glacialis]
MHPATPSTGHDPQGNSRPSTSPSQTACSWQGDLALQQAPFQGDERLLQARQRAKDSMEALQLELRGFGGAVSVRYASWPPDCRVEVSLGDAELGERHLAGRGSDASWGGAGPAGPSGGASHLRGRFVRHDAAQDTIEVRLRDGSTRVVPAKRVRRAARGSPGAGASPAAASTGPGRPLSPTCLS